eukprot:3691264-Alexandrium_andersonii.AAC.1
MPGQPQLEGVHALMWVLRALAPGRSRTEGPLASDLLLAGAVFLMYLDEPHSPLITAAFGARAGAWT